MDLQKIFDKLKEPFPEKDIEWRIQSCGLTKDGKPWGLVLAYIQARAAQDRLDEVLGAENWQVTYKTFGNRIKCSLSVFLGDRWVTKEDGAETTDIEPYKGGLSGAFKRVASVWGIGRYLYNLESGFAQIVDKGVKGAHFAKTKEGQIFYWIPPSLPEWALPTGEKNKKFLEQRLNDFDITYGKFKGVNTKDLSIKQLEDYFGELYQKIEIDKVVPPKQGMELFEKIRDYLEVNS